MSLTSGAVDVLLVAGVLSASFVLFLLVNLFPLYWGDKHEPFFLREKRSSIGKTFCNFDRSHCCDGALFRPKNISHLRSRVAVFNKTDSRTKFPRLLRVVGAGHSMSPLVCGERSGVTHDLQFVSLDSIGGIARINGKGVFLNDTTKAYQVNSSDNPDIADLGPIVNVTAGAGMRLKELVNVLAKNFNVMLPTTPLIDEISLGGMIATAAHGSGASLSSTSSYVKAITMVLANRTMITLSEDDAFLAEMNQDNNLTAHDAKAYFKMARMHLGALGIVVGVTFEVVPLVDIYRRHFYTTVSEATDPKLLDQRLKDYHVYTFWWVSYTDNVLHQALTKVPSTNSTEADQQLIDLAQATQLSSFQSNFDKVFTDISFFTLATLSGWLPSFIMPFVFMALPIIQPSREFSGPASQIMFHPGINFQSVQFSEVEYMVPFKQFQDAFDAFRQFVLGNTGRCTVNAFTPVRFIKRDDIPLSPYSHSDLTVQLSFSLIGKPDMFTECGREIEKVFRMFGGRPHWGKSRYFESREELIKVFPEAGVTEFAKMAAELDPQGLFLTDEMARLFVKK